MSVDPREVTSLPTIQSSGTVHEESCLRPLTLKPPIDGPTPGQSSGISHSESYNLLSSIAPPMLGPTPGQSSGMSQLTEYQDPTLPNLASF